MSWKKLAAVVAGAVAAVGLFTPAASAADYGPYPITNNYGGRCLMPQGTGNGAPVVLWDCWQVTNKWYLRYVAYDSRYQVVDSVSGRCLDANWQRIGQNGTPIQLWDCLGGGQTNQVWWVFQDGNRNYTIENVYNYRVLDADLSQIGHNGTPVQLWDNLGSGQTNQLWGVI